MMIYAIKNTTDAIFNRVTEDPVRPNIPHTDRLGENKDIFAYRDEAEDVKAITCVSYQATVPTSEGELFNACVTPSVAVFYTIWSYAPGAGRSLLLDAVKHIQKIHPNIKRFVTLSPKTVMAERFHIKNGAMIFRENTDTVNYEYVSAISS